MKLLGLLSLAGAALASPIDAIPPHVSASATTTTATATTNTTTYDEAKTEPSVIPIRQVKCLWDRLDVGDWQAAKQKMVDWSDAGHRVNNRDWHKETYGSVTWYICNCKTRHRDPVPRPELDDVEAALRIACKGEEHTSGWVWSKEWDKGYNVVRSDTVPDSSRGERGHAECPPDCIHD